MSEYHRRSIRLKDYDYSMEGGYFITICTLNKECCLGEIINHEIILTPIGNIVKKCWQEIPEHFPEVELDEFIVMPNHIHGILVINGQHGDVARNTVTNYFSKITPKIGSLSTIIRSYKAAVSNWCHKNGFPDFQWQRNYYEHIIRNDKDITQIRTYIYYNVDKWEMDQENPCKIK